MSTLNVKDEVLQWDIASVFERCDTELGCVPKSSIPTISTTYAGTTEPDLLSNEKVTAKETTVTRNGNLNVIHLTSYIDDIYDEVDKKPLTFDTTGSNVTSQASNNETINFVFNESHSNTKGNIDDEAGYFDLYFAMKEDANDQLEDRASQIKSLAISSFTSNVVSQDNTECPKPLQEYCQEDSHAFDVTVTVHQCIKRSSWSDEDATSNIYSNVCIPLQKDKQINSQAKENHLSSESKTVHDTTLPEVIPSTFRTCNLQDCTNKYAESEKTIDACCVIESNRDKSFSEEKSKTF
ncbi:unnamed protein product [Mytilus coruscus]|uniref:Uncharacterized protein n=1 Tax=Mytilus coruscus TaxID=42192 RepID=A0A6J8BNX6_MYTCO|nr:unnamed protein product [Mytilus coruscus]